MSALAELLQPVKKFLGSKALTDFTSERASHIITVKRTATVKEVLKILVANRILSVPVLDSNGQYSGCLSVQDLLKVFVSGLPHDLQDATWIAANKQAATAELSKLGSKFMDEVVSNVSHAGELWINNKGSTLMDVVVDGFAVNDQHVHHRIVVCDPAPHDATHDHPTDKISTMLPHGWTPTTVVSQSDIIATVHQNKSSFGPLFDMTVEDLEIYMGAAMTVPASTPAVVVFTHMSRDHKSSLGVTSEDGAVLLGNLSVSDMRQLAEEDFGLMALPVGEFILVTRGLATAADALAGKHAPGVAEGNWQEAMKSINVIAVSPTTTVNVVLDLLVSHGLHRVYVVDAARHPVGIITLTDLLRVFVQ